MEEAEEAAAEVGEGGGEAEEVEGEGVEEGEGACGQWHADEL